MKLVRFGLLAALAAAFAFSGCYSEEIEVDECANGVCDDDPTFDESPIDETPTDPVEDPVDDPKVEPAKDPKELIQMAGVKLVDADSFGALPNLGQPMDPGDDPIVIPDGELVTPDDLSSEDKLRIEVLRIAIDDGLTLGRDNYLESVSISLQNLGIVDDYESQTLDGAELLLQDIESCPFAKYYDNGFQPTGVACDYLVDMAKAEVYSKMSNVLDETPLPTAVSSSSYVSDGIFWREQGAISGLEEQRALVRYDLKAKEICNVKPTPVQSSKDKGVVVGHQLLAQEINAWLKSKGHFADYPTMSKPIQVCNADTAMLLPAKQQAIQKIDLAIEQEPLCVNYEPPTQEGIAAFGQAKIDYKKGVKEGLENEFALAAVRIFKVIPCNVGDPIVLDLDGDGIELLPVRSGVNFDFYGVGTKQAVAWTAPDDAFLAIDLNGNGLIDNGLELFGNINPRYVDGFDHLASMDTNSDGRLDAGDSGFSALLVWKDANSDGISSRDEIVPFASLGMSEVNLNAMDVNYSVEGNRIGKVAMTRGTQNMLLMGDAFLVTAPYAKLGR